MTIIQLTTFLKIVETNSFSAASVSLGYAQSTVTTQIRQLEEELGTRLFERLGKRNVLTPAGERLVIYAEKLLQIEREIHLEVPESEEAGGILKLGVSESLCYNRLPEILISFKKVCPKAEIRLRLIGHETFPELLRKGELDLVYTLNPLMEDDSLLLLYKQPERLGFYVCPGHALAGRKVSEQDLDGAPMLLTGHTCSFRKLFLDAMAGRGYRPDIVLETDSKEILKQFAENGLGTAFMPDMAAEEEVRTGRLARLDWAGAEFPVYSQVLIHKDKRISKAMEGLVDLIKGTGGQGQWQQRK